MKCKYCKDFNKEDEDIIIDEIVLLPSGHFGYGCPLIHCPFCGTKLKKYENGLTYRMKEYIENGL